MDDTFISWFLITELHIWMLCNRVMAVNNHDGTELRDVIIISLWNDCDQRMNMINVRRSWVLQTAVCDHCSSSCLPTKLRLHQLLTANSKTAACGKIEQWERVLKAEPAL